VRLADVVFGTHGTAVVARLTGEVDLSNAMNLGTGVLQAVSNESTALVLDMTGVDYLDSAGIQLVYHLGEQLRSRGQTLRLVVPTSSPANDALRLAGVAQHVETSESVADALRGLA
jgi:anti-sigma B factor antagonist